MAQAVGQAKHAAGRAKKTAAEAQFTATLAGLEVALRATAGRYPEFAARLREKDLVALIGLRDGSQGRYFTIKGGRVDSTAGIPADPDVAMIFDTASVAVKLMKPRRDYLEFISALKNFEMALIGPDELTVWWSETLQMMLTVGTEYGIDMGGGVRRYTSNTNGGPVFVYVKDGKILRITPIEFDEERCRPVDHRGPRQELHAPAQDHHQLAHPGLEVDGLLPGPHPLPHEAGGLRSQRRAQPAEPGVRPATSASAGTRPSTWWSARSSG